MKKEKTLPMRFNPGLQKFEPDLDSLREDLDKEENEKIIKKIIQKKEYSQLPKKDVEMALSIFAKEKYSDEEKIKLTRKLLREIFSSFSSQKLLSLKNKTNEWILRKHISTRERLPHYEELYKRILKGLNKKISVIDLGSGVNGFSYNYFSKLSFDVNYIAIEGMGQLVNLMNHYFKKEEIKGEAVHLSLFDLEKVKGIIRKQRKPRVVFLFKTIDSLEILKRDYSKGFLLQISPFVDRIVVSFATRSMMKRERFKVKRSWLINFIRENFEVLDDFELKGERYISFRKK